MKLHLLLLPTLLLATACAHIKPARMALPEALGADPARFEELALQGIGGKARGDFRAGDAGGRFERSASRLELFDASLNFDRASASYTLQREGAAPVQAECRARRNEVQRGVLALPVRPFTVDCDWRDGGKLKLDADLLAAGGTQEARKGRYEGGGVVLELRSVHQLQGTKWPLSQPAGYALLQDGVAVGALDLTGVTPRLVRPRAGTPQHDAVTRAALALALLWDPAAT
jgi:hypothetical protein